MPAQDPRQYRPTPEQLWALAERHGIGPITSVRPLAGGIVNPVLLLSEQVVLRINVRDADEPKVPKEAWVLRYLADHPPSRTWRVPRVIAAGTDRSIVPYDYLLLEYTSGRSGAPVAWQADAAHRASLSRQLGEVMAALHALPIPGTRYGAWDRSTASLGGADDWRDLVTTDVDNALAEAARFRVLAPKPLQATRDWLAAHAHLVPRRPSRHLLHYDLSFSNVLVDDRDRIGVVLDFEWTGIGPTASELGLMDSSDELVEDAFWDAYLQGRRLDCAFLQEAHYYRVCSELSFLSISATHWGGAGNAARRQRLACLLSGEPTPFLARFGRPF